MLVRHEVLEPKDPRTELESWQWHSFKCPLSILSPFSRMGGNHYPEFIIPFLFQFYLIFMYSKQYPISSFIAIQKLLLWMFPCHRTAKILYYGDAYKHWSVCTGHIDFSMSGGRALAWGNKTTLYCMWSPCQSLSLVPRSKVAAGILSQKAHFPLLCHWLVLSAG